MFETTTSLQEYLATRAPRTGLKFRVTDRGDHWLVEALWNRYGVAERAAPPVSQKWADERALIFLLATLRKAEEVIKTNVSQEVYA